MHSPRKRFLRVGCGPLVVLALIAGCLMSPYALRLLDVLTWMSVRTTARENRPVDIYGIVVDRENRSLPDAQVTFEVIRPNWPGVFWSSAWAHENHTRTTDTNGRFEFHDAAGFSLKVGEIRLPGHGWNHTMDGAKRLEGYATFYFAERFVRDGTSHKPDPDNPVRFVMRGGPSP